MNGTYTIDGVDYPNVITDAGLDAIMQFLAGSITTWAECIAVGVVDTAASSGDARLGFELARISASSKTYDDGTDTLSILGTLPGSTYGELYEIGVFTKLTPSSITAPKLLVRFNETESVTGGTFDDANSRIDTGGYRLDPAVSATDELTVTKSLGLGNVVDADVFKFAYYQADANLSALDIEFRVDGSNYYTVSVTPAGVGYNVASFSRTDAVVTGSPSWGSITDVRIIATAGGGGAASVLCDGLRVDPGGTESGYALVSRAVLAPAITVDGTNVELQHSVLAAN